LDDSLQPTIDMLLNLSIFIWFGAVCPWDSFATNSVVSMYRLVLLGVLILLLRRLPILFVLRKYIHQIDGRRQAVFMGFFGPIGVSAIFYLYITLEFLDTTKVDGVQRDDARKLGEVVTVVIWFLAICSNVS
jgi:sodium/hydrogen antiporter